MQIVRKLYLSHVRYYNIIFIRVHLFHNVCQFRATRINATQFKHVDTEIA